MSKLVPQGFPTLRKEIFEVEAKGASSVVASLYTAANGLHGATSNGPPPGSSVKEITGHDHTERNGGVPLPRGVLFAFDYGDLPFGWFAEFGGGEGQTIGLEGDVTTWGRFTNRTPDLLLPVTSGVDSQKDALSGFKCMLEGYVMIGMSTPECKIQFWNRTTATYSGQKHVLGGVYNEVFFEDIPCKGGEDNEFILYVWTPVPGSVWLNSLIIAETRRFSQTESQGLYLHQNLPRTT